MQGCKANNMGVSEKNNQNRDFWKFNEQQRNGDEMGLDHKSELRWGYVGPKKSDYNCGRILNTS